jgi:hypothetical protein
MPMQIRRAIMRRPGGSYEFLLPERLAFSVIAQPTGMTRTPKAAPSSGRPTTANTTMTAQATAACG